MHDIKYSSLHIYLCDIFAKFNIQNKGDNHMHVDLHKEGNVKFELGDVMHGEKENWSTID